jgi:hypothetical protein
VSVEGCQERGASIDRQPFLTSGHLHSKTPIYKR